MSFRQRLIYLSATAVAAAVVLASVIVFAVVRGELRGQVDEELRDLVEQIARSDDAARRLQPGERNDHPAVYPLGGSGGYAQIVQPDGTVLRPEEEWSTCRSRNGRSTSRAGSQGVFRGRDRRLQARQGLHRPRDGRGGDSGGARSLEDVDSTLRDLAIALALICVFGIALAVWLGRMVARTALRPVSALTEAAEHVAETRDLSEWRRRAATS